ncbi:Hypothetical protein PBC10988_17750 [Planctomycetales bacterium 10988]|nr:Hypothetical protein PBC10988_17750 [Planctomycetales bacterium 10988]
MLSTLHKLSAKEQPSFELLSPAQAGHEGRALLFVNGYLSDNMDCREWVESFRKAGWQGNIVVLRWKSGGRLRRHIGKTVLQSLILNELLFRGVAHFSGIGPVWESYRMLNLLYAASVAWHLGVGSATIAASGLVHWKKWSKSANREGRRLARYFCHDWQDARPEWAAQELRLVGFSLGCQVVFRALHDMAQFQASQPSPLEHLPCRVDLYGGAVRQSEDWQTATQAVSGTIHNYYSRTDQVLGKMFTWASQGPSIGHRPLLPAASNTLSSTKIQNIDVTQYVPSHLGYQKRLTFAEMV